jgi:hypothetical protein
MVESGGAAGCGGADGRLSLEVGRQYICSLTTYLSLPSYNQTADPQSALGLPAPPHAPAWPDALILVAMLVALRLGVYYTLRTKTRTRTPLMGH